MIAGGIVLHRGEERGFVRALAVLAFLAGDGNHRPAVLLGLRRMSDTGTLDIGKQVHALLGIPDIIALNACGGEGTQPEKLFDRQYARREQHG